jgi:hypothetical protein
MSIFEAQTVSEAYIELLLKGVGSEHINILSAALRPLYPPTTPPSPRKLSGLQRDKSATAKT